MSALIHRKNLLSSVEMAHFVSHGALIFESLVPDDLNAEALGVLDAGIEHQPYGVPLELAFPEGTFVNRLISLPTVAGAIQSLVGPDPTIDHHAVHVRQPHEGEAQKMHGDAIIDPRLDSFDIQLMYYPHAVTLDQGGTLSVPGSHLRRINETDIGRYQNLRGQTRLTCPAGTIVLLHHGIWHGGRRNDSDTLRYMFKIRFNPTVRQLRLWNTDDLDDSRVYSELTTRFPWYENATGRLEMVNRVKLWRALTGNDAFDLDYWMTRVSNRPQRVATGASS